MNAVKEKAYAKINLYLDVLAKRQDGFHDIKTVMHSVSLADEITVASVPSLKMSVKLIVDSQSSVFAYLPTDSNNIAVKAAMAFFEAKKDTADVTIRLKKKIPIAAGLAGGSADAAAVLRALNRLYKRPFTDKKLCEIASLIGSDVPFCLLGKTALCEGRGELITEIESSRKFHFVIANSGEYVSTPTAYSLLDSRFSNFENVTGADERYDKFYKSFIAGKDISDGVFNIFEAPILEKCPKAAEIKEKLESFGALFAMLSGSGPSVFAAFLSESDAKDAAENIRKCGYFAEYALSRERI